MQSKIEFRTRILAMLFFVIGDYQAGFTSPPSKEFSLKRECVLFKNCNVKPGTLVEISGVWRVEKAGSRSQAWLDIDHVEGVTLKRPFAYPASNITTVDLHANLPVKIGLLIQPVNKKRIRCTVFETGEFVGLPESLRNKIYKGLDIPTRSGNQLDLTTANHQFRCLLVVAELQE